MAKNDLRSFLSAYKKPIAITIGIILVFVLCLILTIIFCDVIQAKIYLICLITVSIAAAIFGSILGMAPSYKKFKNPEETRISEEIERYCLSKKQYDQYLKEAKNCDMFAK